MARNALKAQATWKEALAKSDVVGDKGGDATAGTAGYSSASAGVQPLCSQVSTSNVPVPEETSGRAGHRCAMLHAGQGLELEV